MSALVSLTWILNPFITSPESFECVCVSDDLQVSPTHCWCFWPYCLNLPLTYGKWADNQPNTEGVQGILHPTRSECLKPRAQTKKYSFPD